MEETGREVSIGDRNENGINKGITRNTKFECT